VAGDIQSHQSIGRFGAAEKLVLIEACPKPPYAFSVTLAPVPDAFSAVPLN
jgi:hypothetical protein